MKDALAEVKAFQKRERAKRKAGKGLAPKAGPTKHSPSPWSRVGRYTIEAADGTVVAEVTRGTAIPNDANARLMAAAPDLLVALKMAEDWLLPVAERNREAQDVAITLFTDNRMARIRAAIAKAEDF